MRKKQEPHYSISPAAKEHNIQLRTLAREGDGKDEWIRVFDAETVKLANGR